MKSSNRLLEITSITDATNGLRMDSPPKLRSTPVDSLKNQSMPSLPLSSSGSTTVVTKTKKALDVERAISYIRKGYKVLILMRGLPGSGKSYLARQILEATIGYENNETHIISTDDFFHLNPQRTYQYDALKITDAHNWNQRRAFEHLSRGYSPVIIDNTNIQMWEMKPYATMATDSGYIIEIIEPDTHWCFNEKELTKRNEHNVPRIKISEMSERYEKNVTPHKLLYAYNLVYKLQKPPQLRLYPPPNITLELDDNHFKKCITKSVTMSALNDRHTFQKKPSETINLMDFNDDNVAPVQATSNYLWNPVLRAPPVAYNKVKAASASVVPSTQINNNRAVSNNVHTNENSVDRILMCGNDSNSTNILQPQVNDVLYIDSSDEEDNNSKNKQLFKDMEMAWGINEIALKSWDIVTPIKEDSNSMNFPLQHITNKKIVKTDSGSNTEDVYFRILKAGKLTHNCPENVILLQTVSRDINRSTPKRELSVPQRSVLDKSCMTEDIYDDYDNHISQLQSLFPSVPKTHLKYWYGKCKGDLEWTIEFLLEAKEEITSLIDDDSMVVVEVDETTSPPSETELDTSISIQGGNSPKRSKRGKLERSRENSEGCCEDLKKLIESKIDINDQHYSKHLLKVKNFKFGNGNIDADNQQPSTSSNYAPISNNCTEVKSQQIPSHSIQETYSTEEGEVVVIDSDMEFDDIDVHDEDDKQEQKPEDTLELNLGECFVGQLEKEFGDPNMAYPKGFQPVVQVPVTLARQLYTFYIESVYQQMETQQHILEELSKEDEEFARKLQAKEQREAANQAKPTPKFKDIVDEQLALSIHQKEADKWKDLNPDNLAARLTRQKLFSNFPNVDEDTLIEILYAHDNKYVDTVETLLASTGTENVRGNIAMIKEPPIKDDVLQEMKDAKKNNSSEEYEQLQAATFYREEANKFLQRRANLYNKAHEYHQRGMTEVAQFYSGLASQQTMYFEKANGLAATAFLDEHSKRLEDFNTLDLHFLYVKEAIPALDVFLDRCINLLRLSTTKQSDYLQIITGRGNRSENGKPKIRPAVQVRLKNRNIKFVQLNPGLLKVKVTKTSLVTSELF